MSEHNNHYYDWDDSVYGTGPTQPPKNRGGTIALMLILIIFLCGIITVLGIMNIRLFQKLEVQEKKNLAMSFTIGETSNTEAPYSLETAPSHTQNSGVNLHSSLPGVENTPSGVGKSLQDIYAENIDSVASIICSSRSGSSTGTGVILTQDGYLVTNAHVINGASAITVQLTDGRSLSAQLVGMDEVSDLAVLRVDATDLSPATFGDSSSLRVGDTVVAIGDPLGVKFRGTYTDGIVSGIDRDVDMGGRVMTLIQTNAALNSGNSGGPLINCYGQVIGINTMKIGAFTDEAGVEGLGFAIPSTFVQEIVNQLISQGYVSGRPTLGIRGEGLSSFYQYYYRMPAGLYITEIDPGSDAHAKGIEEGDILLSINDSRITSQDDLKTALYSMEAGQTVQVLIYRRGNQYQVELVLAEDKG